MDEQTTELNKEVRNLINFKGEYKINNISKYVVCPYYISDKQGKISCEGVQDKAYNHLVFENCMDKKPYMMRFCCDAENYMNCRICEMLDLKWAVMTNEKE